MHENDQKKTVEDTLGSFEDCCHKAGLKVTPQRVEIYKALVATQSHPTAEEVYKMVREKIGNISLDTVNRTLLTLADIGAAFIVEGTGQPRRFDGGLEDHQHFLCIKCKKIVDFHCHDYDDIEVPDDLRGKVKVLRKTLYFEGICDECLAKYDD